MKGNNMLRLYVNETSRISRSNIRTTILNTLYKNEILTGSSTNGSMSGDFNSLITIAPKENKIFYSSNTNKIVSRDGKTLNTHRITKEQALKIVEMFKTLKELGFTFKGEFVKDNEVTDVIEDMSNDWTEMYNKSTWPVSQ